MHLPIAATEVPEAQSLLRWKVNNDEAIGTGLLCVLQHTLLSIAQQRIVVSHKHDGCLQTALAGIANHLQHFGRVDAILESLLWN